MIYKFNKLFFSVHTVAVSLARDGFVHARRGSVGKENNPQ